MKWKKTVDLFQFFRCQTWRIRQTLKYIMLDIFIQYCFSKTPTYAIEAQRMVAVVGKDR